MKTAFVGAGVLVVGLVALGASKRPATPFQDTVVTEPYVVHETPICSYGVSLRGLSQKKGGKTSKLLITEVTKNSDAEALGLKPGDVIVSLNGVSVDQWVDQKSLDRLLVNRPFGEKIIVEVIERRTVSVTLHSNNRDADAPLEK